MCIMENRRSSCDARAENWQFLILRGAEVSTKLQKPDLLILLNWYLCSHCELSRTHKTFKKCEDFEINKLNSCVSLTNTAISKIRFYWTIANVMWVKKKSTIQHSTSYSYDSKWLCIFFKKKFLWLFVDKADIPVQQL